MAEIRKARKADASKMDRSKMGVTVVQPPREGDVEAQGRHWTYLQCPCYGCVTSAYIDDSVYEWYTCGNCGCAMLA